MKIKITIQNRYNPYDDEDLELATEAFKYAARELRLQALGIMERITVGHNDIDVRVLLDSGEEIFQC